jgi:hypothetical protein
MSRGLCGRLKMSVNNLSTASKNTSRVEEIEKIKNTLSYYEKHDTSEDRLSLMLKLTDLFIDDLNYTEASKLVDDCRELCKKSKNKKHMYSKCITLN